MSTPLYTKINFYTRKLNLSNMNLGGTRIPIYYDKFTIIVEYSPEIDFSFTEKPVKIHIPFYKPEYNFTLNPTENEYWY